MPDQIETYAIEFNKSVLKGLKLSIADIYKQLVKHGISATPGDRLRHAEMILKRRIDRIAMTELCPQVFKAITEQYERMKSNRALQGMDSRTLKDAVGLFNWDIKDTETLDILRKNNVFLTSKYYNRLEEGKVRERIEKAFTEGKSPASIANALRFEFGDMNKGLRSYNEMFVDTISHTARNFANINTYQQIGVEYSQIVGFKDELTCPQCSRLIGRIVSVETQAKAVNDYLSVDFEKLGYEKALEQIKAVNPWWTEKGLIGAGFEKPSYKSDAENIKETAKLIKPGLELPIFHGRCRCSTAAYFENKGSLPLVSGGGGGILEDGTKTDFGKLGELIKNPDTVINYSELQNYTKARFAERNIQITDAENWIKTGKALKQSNGKILYVSKNGAVIVDKNGIIITAYPSSLYDENMMAVVKELFGETK